MWAEPGLPLILTTLRVFFLMLVLVYRTLELHSTQKTRGEKKRKRKKKKALKRTAKEGIQR